jgi:hypothetical protein
MDNNNDSTELQSNSKQACVEVDLANLPLDPCFRKNKWFRFNLVWFKEYDDLLEYNISKDDVYCLYCYLFGPDTTN